MNGRFPQKQNTSEKLKAKQYGAAALICILVAVIMTIIRLIWGNVMLGSGGDKIPLGMVIFLVRNIVLLFGAIDGAVWMMIITACFLTGKAGSVLRSKFRWF